MEASCQIHAPAALPPGKEPLLPIGYEAVHDIINKFAKCIMPFRTYQAFVTATRRLVRYVTYIWDAI